MLLFLTIISKYLDSLKEKCHMYNEKLKQVKMYEIHFGSSNREGERHEFS